MKSKLILALSIASGIFAMFLMQYYINSYKKEINRRYQMVTVVVAGDNLRSAPPSLAINSAPRTSPRAASPHAA